MPKVVSYLIDLDNMHARVRVRFVTEGKHVHEIVVQLEAFDAGRWKAVRRYDDHHGQPHLDYYDRRGHQYRKEWLYGERNAILTEAVTDFRRNGNRYVQEFLEG